MRIHPVAVDLEVGARGDAQITPGDRSSFAYSGFSLAALTTLLHLTVCAARCFPNSEGEATNGEERNSASRAFNFVSASALISLFRISTISALVFLGAQTPYHALAS